MYTGKPPAQQRVGAGLATAAVVGLAGLALLLSLGQARRDGRAVNRDVLVPKKGGRFAFGRLIDRSGDKIGILPPGHGEKQQVVENPAWIGVAEMLVRRL